MIKHFLVKPVELSHHRRRKDRRDLVGAGRVDRYVTWVTGQVGHIGALECLVIDMMIGEWNCHFQTGRSQNRDERHDNF